MAGLISTALLRLLNGSLNVIASSKDGTQIYYKDWWKGQPIVFSHGWPLSADAWEGQMIFLASRGYRCIVHDRRGHGRSSQPWEGNDMNTYADDLAALVEKLGRVSFECAGTIGITTNKASQLREVSMRGSPGCRGFFAFGNYFSSTCACATPMLLMKLSSSNNDASRTLDFF